MSKTKSIEERIESLETALALQDQNVEELNKFIIAQQKQIGDLEKKLELMVMQMKDLKDAVAHASPQDDVPPPHYGHV
ncbi:SlyX family protein [Maridesulfovibrio sp.]|jgi:SlyX protein|uniref:SlyX family protein n=1 Tax=Maridesulfovibrio sp. TaxID=2795000 RepID=UPI0029CA6BA7|nr:SlyX family protein [Maridesulfovibrio sp.]